MSTLAIKYYAPQTADSAANWHEHHQLCVQAAYCALHRDLGLPICDGSYVLNSVEEKVVENHLHLCLCHCLHDGVVNEEVGWMAGFDCCESFALWKLHLRVLIELEQLPI